MQTLYKVLCLPNARMFFRISHSVQWFLLLVIQLVLLDSVRASGWLGAKAVRSLSRFHDHLGPVAGGTRLAGINVVNVRVVRRTERPVVALHLVALGPLLLRGGPGTSALEAHRDTRTDWGDRTSPSHVGLVHFVLRRRVMSRRSSILRQKLYLNVPILRARMIILSWL